LEARYRPGLALEALLDPEAPAWGAFHREAFALMGTPVGLQPTAAIRASWGGRTIGAVAQVEVAACHTGQALAFHLTWLDPTENRSLDDTTTFSDAAAVLFPAVPTAPLVTMGAPGAAVNAWYWRADEDGKGAHVVAEGIGTTRILDRTLVRSRGRWAQGRWHVVILRALRVDTREPVVQLVPGAATAFGVAIWEGGHGERGGIKAFSGSWRGLRLSDG
jgi:DMSO reductase family type II enzyme heme b subunit